jgi:hypothetical protein
VCFPEKWSENDVADLASQLREVSDFELISLIASNVIVSLPETYPVADEAAIDELVRAAAERANSNDLVFVYKLSIGAVHAGSSAGMSRRSEARRALRPLAGFFWNDTVVSILLPPLADIPRFAGR